MSRLARCLALFVVALLAAAPAAAAADPWLDPGFGRDGVARHAAAGAIGAEPIAAALAPGGDTVVLLQPPQLFPGCCFADVGGVALARLAPDGALRTAFGTGGIVQPARSAAAGSAEAVYPYDLAVDSAGRPLVVGLQRIVPVGRATMRPAVQRRTAAGGLDPAFGSGGVAPLPVAAICAEGDAAVYQGVAALAGGRVLAVGTCSSASGFRVLVARLRADGAPDASFGPGGVRALAATGVGACCSLDLRRYADGRHAVAFWASRTMVLRLLPDGTPDPAFAGDGLAIHAEGAGGAVLPLADGGVVISRGAGARLARLDSAGALVAAYDGSGPAVPDGCGYPTIVDLARSGARTVVALACDTTVTLVAVDDAGAADVAWGAHPTDAALSSADDLGTSPLRLLVPQPGGALDVAGVARGTGGGRVVRHGPSGAADTGFGLAGSRALPLVGRLFDLEEGSAVLDAAGRIVSAVELDARALGDEGAILVSRLREDGSLDPTFGGDGQVVVEAGGLRAGSKLVGGEEISRPAVVARADGGIDVVAAWAGGSLAGEGGLLLARLTAAGRPDQSVAPDGRRLLLLPDLSTGWGVTAVAAPGGGLDVGHVQSTPSGQSAALARVRADGTLDPAFGVGGIALMAGDAREVPGPRVLALPGGARLLAWERFAVVGDTETVLARVRPDGTADPSWAGGVGRLVLPSQRVALAVAPDGSIAAGWAVRTHPDDTYDRSADLRILRLRPDGTPQPGFGSRGAATIPAEGTSGAGDDRILALAFAGSRVYVLGDHVRARVVRRLVRLEASGAVDRGFGGGRGRVVLGDRDVNVGGLAPPDLLVDATGRVAAVDTTFGATGAPRDVRAVRVLPAVLAVGGTRPGTVTAPMARVTWAGVAGRYVLERRAAPARGGFGAWAARTVGAHTAATVALRRGSTTCVRVRPARGAASAAACFASPLAARALAASAGWRTTRARGAYAGAVRSATRSGATLRLAGARGRSLALVATRCPRCGVVEVRFAGRLLRRVSLAGPLRRAVVIPLGTFASVRSGAVVLRVASRGRPVRIEGLAVWRDDA